MMLLCPVIISELPFKVVCIDDRDRPNEIPEVLWLKEGEEYEVKEINVLLADSNRIGFKLVAPNIDACAPYDHYSAERFAIKI
jgi:hypothetical protein